MVFRRFHFLSPVIHSQTHTLKGWPGHRLVKIGLATRPSIAKWQFQNSFLFFLRVWVKLVALFYSDNLIALNSAAVLSVHNAACADPNIILSVSSAWWSSQKWDSEFSALCPSSIHILFAQERGLALEGHRVLNAVIPGSTNSTTNARTF